MSKKYMRVFRCDCECQLSAEVCALQDRFREDLQKHLARVPPEQLMTVEAAMYHAVSTAFSMERITRYSAMMKRRKAKEGKK